MRQRSSLRPVILTTTFLLLSSTFLAGCAAGPDFEKPQAPTVSSYGPEGMPSETVSAKTELGGLQRFESGKEVSATWWDLFQSAELNRLIEQAVKNNPSLEAARASLRAAEETATASGGAFFPSVSGSASDNRNKASGSEKPFTVYNTSVAVSYAPDIFGATRRTVESAEAKAEAASFELEAAYLTLVSNVVSTTIKEASLRDQIAATKSIISAQKKQLDLTRQQLAAGSVSRAAVLSQEANLASSEATLPALENALAQNRHLMATLLGQFPSEDIGVSFTLSSLKLPENLPVSLPSQLVEQRPDIRASQALLRAANADIGIATAAMLPQFSLTGGFGVSAARMADMFSPTTAIWGLGASLLQPIFQGGELLHKKRAAVAAFDQAAAEYRATVLSAFEDVANSLKALETDAQALKSQLAAERAAAANLDLTTRQFNAGAISNIDLLTAQANYQKAKIALVQAKAARLADTAALFQALGGGWQKRAEPIATKTE